MLKKPTYRQLERRITELEKAISDLIEDKSASINNENFLFPSDFEKHESVMLLIEPDSGSIIDANLAAQKYYGYTIETLKKMTIQDINILTPQEVTIKMNQAVTEELNSFIFPHRLSNGEVRTVEAYSSPILLKGRKLLLSIINDVTERKQLEKKLGETNIILQQMLDGTQDIIAFQKPDHTIMRLNRAGYDLFGKPAEEIDGRKCYELIGRKKECNTCATSKALKSKHVEVIEKYDSGLDKHLMVTATPMLNHKGEVDYVIEQLTDITNDKIQKEESLKKTEELERYSKKLEEMNTALKVLIAHRNEEMEGIKKNFIKDFEKLVLPYFPNPNEAQTKETLSTLISIIEQNINNILFHDRQNGMPSCANLTPTEMRVAFMVKSNKTSKEIADSLNISVRSVFFHRENIRRKLNLTQTKTNLRTYLQSQNI